MAAHKDQRLYQSGSGCRDRDKNKVRKWKGGSREKVGRRRVDGSDPGQADLEGEDSARCRGGS